MNEIERLNPGLVTRATTAPHPVTRRAVALTGKTPKVVLAELARRQRAGEVESAGALQLITTGALAGQYAVRVVLLPERPPVRWPRRLTAVGVALMGLAAVVGAFAWLVTAMSAASLAGVCVILLGVLAVAVAAGRKPGGGNVTVISNINVGR